MTQDAYKEAITQPFDIQSGGDFLLHRLGLFLFPQKADLGLPSIRSEAQKFFAIKNGSSEVENKGYGENRPPLSAAKIKLELHRQVGEVVKQLRRLRGVERLDRFGWDIIMIATKDIANFDYADQYCNRLVMQGDSDQDDIPNPVKMTRGVVSGVDNKIKTLYDSYVYLDNTTWGIISDAINKDKVNKKLLHIQSDDKFHHMKIKISIERITCLDQSMKDLYGCQVDCLDKDVIWYDFLDRRHLEYFGQNIQAYEVWNKAVQQSLQFDKSDMQQQVELEMKYGSEFFYPPASLLSD